MNADETVNLDDDLLPEYDMEQLEEVGQGLLAERYHQTLGIVKLAPDVAAAFPTEAAVNEALRFLIRMTKTASFQQVAELTTV